MKAWTTSRATVFVLLCGACLLAVAGCSGTSTAVSAPSTPAATSAQIRTAATTTGAGGSSESAGAASAAKCSTLKPADVQFLLADPATGPTITASGTDGDGQLCDFNNADADQTVEIIVVPSTDPVFGFDAQQSANADAKTATVPVTGVGARAFRDADDYTPTADGNGITCFISASIDQVPAAAGMIIGGHSITLNSAQEDAVATALGTVCNRIFGSGPTTPDLSALHG